MSLSSIPGSLLSSGLSALYTGNPIPSPNNNNTNHNHYHSTNQFHHAHNQHQQQQQQDSHSQLLNAASVLFLRGLNRTSSNNSPIVQQSQTAVPPSNYNPNYNYNSNSLFSFLYSENEPQLLSTTSPSTVISASHEGFSDYDSMGIDPGDGDSVQDAFVEGSHLWSLLVVGYSLVFTIGVIGNTVLLAALCGTGSRARALPVRNHLMVNLAAADLLVTAVCVPISACAAASHACWPNFLVSWMCQLGPLLQRTPVAASTLSLALLSLDRWAAIRHPRFAQRFRERRFVAMSMAIIWILASVVALPTFWARQWDEHSQISYWNLEQTVSEVLLEEKGNSSSQFSGSGVCVERWTNVGVQLAYAATYNFTAFISPALIVAACHASVSHKLTAQLKVLSGATSGDRFIASRPRPKQVLIVARDPSNNIIPNPTSPLGNQNGAAGNNINGSLSRSGSLDCPVVVSKPSHKFVTCDPNSDDEDDVFVRMQIEADLESFRQLSTHIQQSRGAATAARRGVKSFSTFRSEASVSKTNNNNMLKASKRETSIIRAHRKLRKKFNVPSGGTAISAKLTPTPLLPTYSSQSFRSRRRAANLLAALAAVFCCCWAPYVVCALLEMFLKEKSLVRLLIPFSLFLGHAHSAINPVVSWRLNRSAFVRFQRQSILSFLPDWLTIKSCGTCRLFCYSCTCTPTCCDNSQGEVVPPTIPGQPRTHPPRPLFRAGTRYPGTNQNHNPFLNQANQRNQQNQPRLSHYFNGQRQSRGCLQCGYDSENAEPCCCCFCPSGMFRRRSSSPDDLWRNNTSTNEAALGAFHPKYLSRLPAPDPVSKCHTSHFLR